jgi:hypothetical protein
MLPPGHIAAGYLVAEALIRATHVPLTDTQTSILLLLGMFFAFAPDLDMFYGFATRHEWTASSKTFNHRRFMSHVPVLWLIAGLGVYIFAATPFMQCVGLLLWLGSWSHFLLDSIESGVMWLWPFSHKVFALKNPGKTYVSSERRFFKFWTDFVQAYFHSPAFPFELIIITAAITVFLLSL